jgi:methylated-DNA-protein-cysteine methyltransferase related protein
VPEESLPRRILAAVESIPPGRVMTYGDVAEYAGTRAPRVVGRVLALDGGTVPWHRVVRADGTCARHLATEQRRRLSEEGVRFDGDRVPLSEFRWPGHSAGLLESPGIEPTLPG